MLKGQLSRVPWPGNLRMPFTALRVLQQPHRYSHSLQPAIHTQLAYHYIQYALSTLSFSFVSPRGFLQSAAWPHQSTKMVLERAASHIKVTRPPRLFWLPPWEL